MKIDESDLALQIFTGTASNGAAAGKTARTTSTLKSRGRQ